MSTERGNTRRTRPQKYQNTFVFKNSLHDTSNKTKFINNLQIVNTCEKCKNIIEWKIKYKKYKPLSTPGKCNKCGKKAVKHAYHTMCGSCAKEHRVCPKCGKQFEILNPEPSKEEEIKIEAEMQEIIKSLSERKRRTFLRYMNKQKTQTNNQNDNRDSDEGANKNDDLTSNEESKCIGEHSRQYMLNKLQSLVIEDETNSDHFDSSSEDS